MKSMSERDKSTCIQNDNSYKSNTWNSKNAKKKNQRIEGGPKTCANVAENSANQGYQRHNYVNIKFRKKMNKPILFSVHTLLKNI
jgi:hypothetical protein